MSGAGGDRARGFLQEAIEDPSRLDSATILAALRVTAESVGRVADQGVQHAQQMKDIADTLHAIDKRLAVLESNSVGTKVDDHEKRIAKLEAERQRVDGAIGVGAFLVKNWPGLFGAGGVLYILARSKGINL